MKFLHILMDLGGLEDGIALFGEKVEESFKSMEVCWGKDEETFKSREVCGQKRRKPLKSREVGGKAGGNLQIEGSLWGKEEGPFKSMEICGGSLFIHNCDS